MQRLCRITVPGLAITRDFGAARERLLAQFPNIEEVIATTTPGTLLVLSSGPDELDAWLESLAETVATGQPKRTGRRRRLPAATRLAGDDSAA